MTAVRNPRDEVLVASRHRSGSSVDEEDNIIPPKSPPSLQMTSSTVHNDNIPVRDQGSIGRLKAGSTVSRMKERFQQGSGVSNDNKANSLPSRFTPSSVDTDKSPETKRKKMTEVSTSRVGQSLGSAHSDLNLNEATNHVQRFNYTRALFARLEEQNRATHEPVKLTRPRRLSPSGGFKTPSPMLSPSASSPTSPEPYKRSPSDDRVLNSRQVYRDSAKKPRSSSESSDKDETSRRSRADFRPGNITAQSDKMKLHSNAPGGLLWKRRQSEEQMDISTRDRSDSRESVKPTAVPSTFTSARSRFSRSGDVDRGRTQSSSDALGVRSRSDSRESNGSGGRSSSSDGSDKNIASQPSKTDSDVVLRRKKTDQSDRMSASGRRLSREEIQAALSRADTYLAHRTEMNDFQAKRRSWELREQNAESNDLSNIYGWSKYKYHRRSRSTDALDDRKCETDSKVNGSIENSVNGTEKDFIALRKSVSSSVSEPDISGKYVSSKSLETDATSSSNKIVSQTSKPPIPSKPPVSSKPKVQNEPNVQTAVRKPTRPAPVPRRTAPPPPPKHSPPPLPQQSSVPQSNNVSLSSENLQNTEPDFTTMQSFGANASVSCDSVLPAEEAIHSPVDSVASSEPITPSVAIEKTDTTEESVTVPVEDVINTPEASVHTETIDKRASVIEDLESNDYEPVMVKRSVQQSVPPCDFPELPPPPPYPKPPPPPYQSVVSSSSFHSRVPEDPPSPAPQPTIPAPQVEENVVVAHHYENVSSSSYVRDKQPGVDPNESVVDGEIVPPSPVRRMVNSMTYEESQQIIRKG